MARSSKITTNSSTSRIDAAPQNTRKRKRDPEPESSEASDASDHEQDSIDKEDPSEDSGDEDADAPRAVQWADSDEEESEDEEDDSSGSGDAILDEETALRKDMSEMSFGALLKARQALAEAVSDSDDSKSIEANSKMDASEDDLSGDDAPEATSSKGKQVIDKRSNKHAPTEVSSKRPVGRFRQIVDLKKTNVRDPRFNPLSGALENDNFQSSYAFLPELHVSELATLKENLVRAKKLLANSPRDLREERAAEVQRLELAVRRMESVVQRERRQKVERVALEKIQHEEKEKRKQGKGAWHIKKADQKEILLKARYDDLATTGKRGAVQKAIERKQKKIAQKEKKSRPFPAPRREPSSSEGGGGYSRGGHSVSRGRGGSSRGGRGRGRGGGFHSSGGPPMKRPRFD